MPRTAALRLPRAAPAPHPGNGAGASAASPAGAAARRFVPPLSVTRPELLDGGSDGEFRRLIWGLLVVAQRLPKFPEAFGRRLGLSGAMYAALIAVAHRQGEGGPGEGGVAPRALAAYMHLPAPHVTTTLNALVARGLVAKRRNPADGRGVLVSLTRAGEAALARLAPFQSRVNDVLFARLTRGEFKTFARFIELFVDNTERALAEAAALDRADPHGRTPC
jgi:MarR family transcriptional regulator, organic hydroperoxide resistance regulator